MNTPFFSIIVPIYNSMKYLRRCINSILTQTFSDYEVILINDGSTDESGTICDSFKNNPQIHVIHQLNSGASCARNRGICAATGQYIIFVDSDDYLDCDSLFMELHSCCNATEADIVTFGHKKVTNNGVCIDNLTTYPLNSMRTYDFATFTALNLYYFSICGKAIKRILFNEHDLYFIKGITCEDMDWCVRLAISAQTFSSIKGTPYAYVQHQDSTSRKRSEQRLSDIEANIEKCLNLINQPLPSKTKNALNLFISQFMSMYLIILSDYDYVIVQKHLTFAQTHLFMLTHGNRFRERILYCYVKIFGIKLTLQTITFVKKITHKY